MINTVIFSIFSICLLAGLVFLFALLVKALKKYINSDKTHTHTSNEESERKHQNIIKTFTFWFVIVAIIGIVLNLTGIDDIGLFIGFNPLLNFFSSTKSARDAINAIPYLWHILSVISMTGYGLIIDAIRLSFKKNK